MSKNNHKHPVNPDTVNLADLWEDALLGKILLRRLGGDTVVKNSEVIGLGTITIEKAPFKEGMHRYQIKEMT